MNKSCAAGLSTLCASALLLAGSPAAARLVEENLRVPITVQNSKGRPVARDVVLTVFHDDAIPGPYPLLILNHGRAVDAASRGALGRARYSVASVWFAHRGFLVAVPTRIGYGVTGGEDVEDSGSCKKKNYEPAYAASADLTQQVIATLRRRRDVVPDRTVIAGQSFGGTTAITLAARNPAGVQAVINFAGGGGGNPEDRPGRPCAPRLLERLFASYGTTARLPTLWIYAENDRFSGPKYPRTWFDAFRAAGGSGEFHQFPPSGEDGHRLFTEAPEVWQPVVVQFLNANGFSIKK
jgi:dienelactone hydrolase